MLEELDLEAAIGKRVTVLAEVMDVIADTEARGKFFQTYIKSIYD